MNYLSYICTIIIKIDITMKAKVTAILIKWGNNPQDVEDMVSKHFDYASTQVSTPTQIANWIRTIY